MKITKLKNYISLLFLILFCYSVNSYSVNRDVENITYPAKQNGVTDVSNLLSVSEFESINQKIIALEHEKGAQLAILIVPTTQPLSIEQYSNEVFNSWRLGRLDVDDGVLLVVALKDRTVRIEVGYGLEGQITDNFASKVINNYIVPYFKAEQYSKGIENAVDVLIAQIKNEPLPAVGKTPFYIAKQPEPLGFIDVIAGILIGGGLLCWIVGLYRLTKSHPLKAGIPILIILGLTGYFGGFDITTWNGVTFGEDFLRNDLPRWVQVLFLQLFPCWFSVVMVFTCFIIAALLCFCLLGGVIFVINKSIKSSKLKQSIFASFMFGLFAFIFSLPIFGSFTLSLIITIVIMLLTGIGTYTGVIKPGNDSGLSRSRSGRSSGYSGGSSSSSRSSSSSSGGGGRSGGGGASGRW